MTAAIDQAVGRLRGNWDEDGTVSVHLPVDVARTLLRQAGWDYVGHGCWTNAELDSRASGYISTDEAVQIQILAQTIEAS